MGARQSRNVKLVQQDPELERLVMEYLQQFDSKRSNKGLLNRSRREIDVESVQAMLQSKEAMDGLRKIFEDYEASRSSNSAFNLESDKSARERRKYRSDGAFAA